MNYAQETVSARPGEFLAAARKAIGVEDLETLPFVTAEPAVEAERVVIEDPARLTPGEITALARGFHSRFAMVAFECCRMGDGQGHPLALIGSQVRDVIQSKWPLAKPSDEADGTTKIRDTGAETGREAAPGTGTGAIPGIRPGESRSRSYSSLGMAAHQDGWLSLRGVPAVTGLWADSVPVKSAATYSQNILRLAIDLWRSDEEAFTRLLADDAVKIVGRDGDTAATSPVLFVEKGSIRTFFREPNEEYSVVPGGNDDAARRAIDFLAAHTSFGANGSAFTYLDRPGRGLLLSNRLCVHGRTPFTDGDSPGRRRIIASRWWASDDEYRDVIWR